jgi:putative ABC transport system permease protein
MAARDVANSLSRTSIAIAALMVAVSVTIGVSVMVSSFRHTVIAWLDQTLQGDIYISAPTLTSTTTSAPVEREVIAALQSRPEVEQVLVLRSVTVDSPSGPVHIAASSNHAVAAERLFQSATVPADQVPAAMLAGGVLVSEPFANRYGVRLDGPGITLSTDKGDRTFPVIGIYYDYSSTQGTVMMLLDIYRQHWDDPEVTAVALQVRPDVPLDGLVSALRADLNPLQRLVIRANQTLRQEVLTVFDRTFAITSALQLLATIVAFIGILSALLSLELERQRELGILRAVGLTVRQLWQLIFLQTGLMGSVAGVLAMPTGFVLSLILVYIINRRSFGWTLQMQVLPEPFIQAYLVAVVAALLAGIYPVYRMSRISEADAMRYE